MKEKIKEIAKSYEQETIDFRRELHMNPETSMEEFRTTKRISEELTKAGIEHRIVDPVGVIAEIKGGKAGKTVALRADMDALSMDELNDVPYKSQIPGKMHGCGHDAHTAMLLCAAKTLNKVKDGLKGNVRFLFQPSEETVSGAPILIADGAMDGVDNIFGMHVNPSAPTFTAGVDAGPSYANADIVSLKFKGVGGHGAQPDKCVDAVVMASYFVCNVQTVISRMIDPVNSGVVTFGSFNAGTRFNIIAQEATLVGTVRSFTSQNRDYICEAIKRIATDTAHMFGGEVEIEYNYASPSVINEERSANLAKKVVVENFGNEHLVPGIVIMWAEDFSYYLQKANGCFISLGVGNKEKRTDFALHNSNFNVDEDALCFGVQMLCLYAYSYLEQDEF